MIKIVVQCSGCAALSRFTNNSRDAVWLLREELRKQGWQHVKGSTVDRCPACARSRPPATETSHD